MKSNTGNAGDGTHSILADVAPKQLFFSVKEVATLLNIKESTVREWIYQGMLPAKKFGRAVRIPRDVLEQWINEQPNAAGWN